MQLSTPRDGIVIATAPAGNLTAANVDGFREQFQNIIETHPQTQTIILDLAEITFMDSSGLGTLIALLKKMSESGGDIKLTSLHKDVRLVFEITKTYKVFDIYDTPDEALRMLT